MQQLIIKFIALRTLPPPHSYGNQRLQWQFDGQFDARNMLSGVCDKAIKFYD